MTDDVFRPPSEPARALYDAFQTEARKRPGRDPSVWVEAERKAVWAAARDYAQMNDLKVLTLDEIQAAENLALGHIDYGAKWAYCVRDKMMAKR